jgi:DNA invertase Pin-like site-specific DNA recombinase
LSDGKTDESGKIAMVRIGYARVSTVEQDVALQLDALHDAGCDRIFEDRASGAKTDRPGLAQALAFVREGDVLVTWNLIASRVRSHI